VQQPESEVRLSSSLIPNNLFCAYPKCLRFDKAEQADISLPSKSPQTFINCFCPPLTLPEESDLTVVLSEQTYWIRLHRKCRSWLQNIPKEKEIAVALLAFILFRAIREVTQVYGKPCLNPIFLMRRLTSFLLPRRLFSVHGTKMYFGIKGHCKSKGRDGNAVPIWKGRHGEQY